jgi:hypothetical protein
MANMSFTNNAATTLASSITSSATSLTVASSTGSLFPTLSGSQYFYCTLSNVSGTVEIVKVTARSTDTFTIVRGQDNTSAVAWNSGDKVELRLVAASLNNFPKLDEANTFTGANAYGTPASITLTNATNLPNSGLVNSSITVTAGTGLSGGGSVALGGSTTLTNAGVTSAVAGTGIGVSASTGAVTISNTGVSSFAGQTGAVDPTVLGAIGSVMQVFVNSTSASLPNTTIAGSNLYYPNTTVSANASTYTTYSVGGASGYSTINLGTGNMNLTFQDVRGGNTGATQPRGSTTLSGTWRILNAVAARLVGYDSCSNSTTSQYYGAYAVRIS